ncbi:MAG: outer-membrane lipoprotein carrier protein LolA [SAR86 cluster bacterium]|nr:outer-membrane lipoprotein carrier protein LolA [SAR86 cluster bacterium]
MRFPLFSFFLIFITLPLFSSEKSISLNTSQNNQLIKEALSNDFMTASFTQKTIHNGEVRDIQGVVYRSKNNKFRLKYLEPLNELYISDGKNLLRYDPLLEQLEIIPLEDLLEQTPIGLITLNYISLLKIFNITECVQFNLFINCTIEPSKKENLIQSATISFQNKSIKKIKFNDYYGQEVFISFIDVRNDFINEELFMFNPPPGTDIIRHQKTLP